MFRLRARSHVRLAFLVSAVLILVAASACTPSAGPASPGSRVGSASPTVPASKPASTAAAPKRISSPPDGDYRLVFDSEFNGSRIDTSKWLTRTRWGREPTNELEHYSADALKVSDGMLKITASHKTTGKRAYTSGAINTYGKYAYTYGYAEIRARVPKGAGLWPAFWIASNANTKSHEIDILEMVCQKPNESYLVMHYRNPSNKMRNVKKLLEGPDFSEGFHTWALDWTPEHVIWYVDGVEQYRIDKSQEAIYDFTIPDKPMYVILNLAMGGWAGEVDDDALPADFLVDYIRIYQKK